MGNLTAMAIAESGVTLEQGLAWHLTSNHYPPVPTSMIPVCIEAIEAANEADWHREIDLPFDGLDRNGEPFQITWRGNAYAPVWAIVEGHHLENFIDYQED